MATAVVGTRCRIGDLGPPASPAPGLTTSDGRSGPLHRCAGSGSLAANLLVLGVLSRPGRTGRPAPISAGPTAVPSPQRPTPTRTRPARSEACEAADSSRGARPRRCASRSAASAVSTTSDPHARHEPHGPRAGDRPRGGRGRILPCSACASPTPIHGHGCCRSSSATARQSRTTGGARVHDGREHRADGLAGPEFQSMSSSSTMAGTTSATDHLARLSAGLRPTTG